MERLNENILFYSGDTKIIWDTKAGHLKVTMSDGSIFSCSEFCYQSKEDHDYVMRNK